MFLRFFVPVLALTASSLATAQPHSGASSASKFLKLHEVENAEVQFAIMRVDATDVDDWGSWFEFALASGSGQRTPEIEVADGEVSAWGESLHTLRIPFTDVPMTGVISLHVDESDGVEKDEDGEYHHIQSGYIPVRGSVTVSIFGDENLEVVTEATVRTSKAMDEPPKNFAELIQDWWTVPTPRPDYYTWFALSSTSFRIANKAGVDPLSDSLNNAQSAELAELKPLIEKLVLNNAIRKAYEVKNMGHSSSTYFGRLRLAACFILGESYSCPLGIGSFDRILHQFQEKYGEPPIDPALATMETVAVEKLKKLME